MNTPVIKISQNQFDAFDDALNLMSIIEKKSVSKAPVFKGKLMVPTMAVGTGTGSGWSLIKVREIVPLAYYKGDLEPLPYFDHFTEVEKGNRERSYCGMLINFKGKAHVFTESEFELSPITEAIQIALF